MERGLEMHGLREHYSLEELEAQYERQAEWSSDVVSYYWPKEKPCRVLDVGCGPAPDYFLEKDSDGKVGFDIDFEALKMVTPKVSRVQGTSVSLPFKDDSFDVVLCQYLLMWVPMEKTLKEMWRVTAPGGRLICASEPDYEERQEAPVCIKPFLIEAMVQLGANPRAGAELEKGLAALTNRFETGVLEPIEDREFQLSELNYDIEFLSRLHKKDMHFKARPLIRELKADRGIASTPVYYGCAFK
jgi:SAM-dependent methyltransferase